ncbi:MerR family transcriptional regulator [Pseudarthrobacter sp. AL07]|uniref:MerR family transcriptional regulator n=1 Tax=unclassified Pseudarthrobacter TaxID=2647000 RepID=UPI00249C1B61|nr:MULTISPECIES: MerR family transcriptional regulator [unclassified Pseudarthrobacter]MDI3195006.1 MerR family transcriptional regulator [Pseudarthrobacter sp. AL20]MDI3209122.1 MerR family transcriptional regulator [Pseudarthrobacter sp. AL07]
MGTLLMLTIGRAAKHTGLTPKAIRLYERRGLIRTPPRSSGGYRLYTADDIDTMAFIRRARSLGLALEDIAGILTLQEESGTPPCATVRGILTQRVQDIDDTIAHLAVLRSALVATRDSESLPGEAHDGCPIVNAGHRRVESIQTGTRTSRPKP